LPAYHSRPAGAQSAQYLAPSRGAGGYRRFFRMRLWRPDRSQIAQGEISSGAAVAVSGGDGRKFPLVSQMLCLRPPDKGKTCDSAGAKRISWRRFCARGAPMDGGKEPGQDRREGA